MIFHDFLSILCFLICRHYLKNRLPLSQPRKNSIRPLYVAVHVSQLPFLILKFIQSIRDSFCSLVSVLFAFFFRYHLWFSHYFFRVFLVVLVHFFAFNSEHAHSLVSFCLCCWWWCCWSWARVYAEFTRWQKFMAPYTSLFKLFASFFSVFARSMLAENYALLTMHTSTQSRISTMHTHTNVFTTIYYRSSRIFHRKTVTHFLNASICMCLTLTLSLCP